MARQEQETQPWDPLPGEQQEWWLCFVTYLHMHPKRSTRKVARIHNRSVSWVTNLSSKYEWLARCRAWDAWIGQKISRAVDEIQLDAIDAMRRRHIAMGLSMQNAAVKELNAWISKIDMAQKEAREIAVEEGRDPLSAYHEPILSVRELIKLANEGTAIERLNRGEPTDVTEVKNTVDDDALGNLSKQEILELKRLKAKMDGDEST